jgi:hypothetical protein
MEFLDISSLGVAYRYAVKIEQKFKHQNKREFGSANPQQPKYDKDNPNKQSSENQSKPQENKGHRKTKKDTGKWCDFHKSLWHNTDECRSKQSLVVEIKDKEQNLDSEFDSENNGKIQIIDADPTAIVATTTIHPEEPHLNRGRQTVGIVDNTTPATIQHQVASPRTRSSCQPAMSIVIRHPALQG